MLTLIYLSAELAPQPNLASTGLGQFIRFHLFFKERVDAERFGCPAGGRHQARSGGVLGGSEVGKLEIWGLALLKADEK